MSKNWFCSTDTQINKMTYDEAREIILRQIELGHSEGKDFKPRKHMTKALEIVLEYADRYNKNICLEKRNEY